MPRASDGVLARSVGYTRQHTTVFERAPIVSGSAAVLLGKVTNNAQAEIELAVGGVDGRLAVFKAGHSTPGPYFEASGETIRLASLVMLCCDVCMLWRWRRSCGLMQNSAMFDVAAVRSFVSTYYIVGNGGRWITPPPMYAPSCVFDNAGALQVSFKYDCFVCTCTSDATRPCYYHVCTGYPRQF